MWVTEGSSEVTDPDFFVSYTGADREWAEWIAWTLEAASYRVVIQAWDFTAGTHLVEKLHRATEQAPRTVVVLSAAYLTSVSAAPEWQAAWAADPSGRARKLLVFRVEECDRPGLLGQIVSVDLFGITQDAARHMVVAAAAGERGKPATEPGFPGALGGAGATVGGPVFPPDLPPVRNAPPLAQRAIRESLSATMADQIAVAVRRRWEAEVELRRVNDPYTIPVRWEAAEEALVTDWAVLQRAACSAGWPEPDRAWWAPGPAALAGGGDHIAGLLARVPTGRLLVLGEPGAGKTILIVRLVLDLLARRAPGGPVPVLVPLASWDPTREHLWDWLERRLCLDHPALRARVTGTRRGVSWARALWDAGLFLPVLDGLDEITEAAHGRALAELNKALRPGVGLVLTARTGPYRAAVSPDDGAPGVQLSGAAGIQLCPLDAGVVADYLRAAAGGPAGRARWGRVLDVLTDPAHPVGQALTTPLMATLARTIYTPRPGEPATGLPNPDDLLGPGLASRQAVERHLFDGFLPAAYRPHPDPALRCPWKPADAQRWLVFLAGHLEHRLGGTTDLAWWQLRTAAPRTFTGLVAGAGSGAAAALLSGCLLGPLAGLLTGLLGGLAFGIPAGFVEGPDRPAQGLRWSLTRGGLAATLLVGLVFGLAIGLAGGLTIGLTAGLTVALMFALTVGLRPRPGEPTEATTPHTILGQDRSTFRNVLLAFVLTGGLTGGLLGGLAAGLTIGLTNGPTGGLTNGLTVGLLSGLAIGFTNGLAAGLAVGLAAGLTITLTNGLANGLTTGLTVGFTVAAGLTVGLATGLVIGLAAGLAAGLSRTTWGWFAAARWWLALRGQLPWRLMRFLTDAHQQRGALRQAGAAYQFRHAELQRHLAGRL